MLFYLSSNKNIKKLQLLNKGEHMRFFIFLLFFTSINLISVNTVTAKQKSSRQIQNRKLFSKHWFGTLPFSQNSKNPLLIHDIFVISFDVKKKIPLWIAYQLSPAVVWGDLKAERKYVLDPFLSPDQSLSSKDYKGASNCDGKQAGYDRGHLAPLGSFKASSHAYQAQYLSNIVPQKRNLNQGPWRVLEEQVRKFVKKGNEVRILTGSLYGKEGKDKTPPCWKAAQGKIEELPAFYWKIIASKQNSKIKFCAFLFPQDIKNKKDSPKKYKVKLNELEQKTSLKFFTQVKKAVIQDCKLLFLF